jgi:large subunit ribosomal protein L9
MVKVIFLENIEDNKVGDVKEVADGYARNFLFKKEIAKLATDDEVKNLETKIAKLKKEEETKVKDTEKIAERLKKEKIILTDEVNEDGHLYGSITNREVADKLQEMKYEIEPADIEITEQIKELGEFPINVKLGHGVETEITIKVDRAK